MATNRVPRSTTALITAVAAIVLAGGCGASSNGTHAPPFTGAMTSTAPGAAASSAASTGSEPSAGSTLEAKPPANGSVHVTDAANGYSLELPAGWLALPDESRAEPVQVSGPTAKNIPAAVSAQAKHLYESGPKFIAIEDGTNLSSANVNVVVKPAGGADAKDIMKFVPAVRSALAALHPTSFTSKQVTLGDKPAAQIDYTYDVAGNKGGVSARLVYAVNKGKTYIVTITRATTSSPSPMDTIATSIRFS